MNDIKKTPLEHALDLIQAQKAWIMAVPDHTPLPAMPGFDREEADQLEAFLAEQVAFEKSLNTLPEHDALVAAVTMCPHTIKGDRVTLEWDGKQGQNTALGQLTTRIHEWKKQFPSAAEPATVQEPSIAACIIGSDAVGKKIDGYEAAKVYAAMQKAMGTPPAQTAAPEDMSLVPNQPTQLMRDAGNKALDRIKTEPGMMLGDRAYYAYRAMLAAAPEKVKS